MNSAERIYKVHEKLKSLSKKQLEKRIAFLEREADFWENDDALTGALCKRLDIYRIEYEQRVNKG